MTAILVGLDLRIGPTTALQGLYVTPQGKVEAETSLLLALAQRSAEWEGYTTTWTGTAPDNTLACTVTLTRRGKPPVAVEMHMTRARAWGWLGSRKDRLGNECNVWLKDTALMLELRALAWAIRRQFADEATGIYAQGEITGQEKERERE